MATVESRTRISIDELVNDTIVSGYVTPDGTLILVTRGGAEINAGYLASQPIREIWKPTLAYHVGDVVGYAGSLYRANEDNQNEDPPPFNTSLWLQIAGDNFDRWVELDPHFYGDELTASWNTYFRVGSPVVSLTTVPGEFESGFQAMKIAMAAGEKLRFYSEIENLVDAGEDITVQVRARRLPSALAPPTLYAELLQSPADTYPGVFQPDVSYIADGPARSLTDTWNTYTFHFSTTSAKPRAMVNFLVSANSGAASTALIESVRIVKGTTVGPIDATDFVPKVLTDSPETVVLLDPADNTKRGLVIRDNPSNPRVASAYSLFSVNDYLNLPIFQVPPFGGPKVFGDHLSVWTGVFDQAIGMTPWGTLKVGHEEVKQVFFSTNAPLDDETVDQMTRIISGGYIGGVYTVDARAKVGDLCFSLADPSTIWKCTTGGTYASPEGTWEASAGGGGTDYDQTFSFASASTTWSLPHNQGTKALNVYSQDTFGNELRGDVTYPDVDHMQINFYYPQTGTARVFS